MPCHIYGTGSQILVRSEGLEPSRYYNSAHGSQPWLSTNSNMTANFGAEGGGRTLMTLRSADFESAASPDFTTPALHLNLVRETRLELVVALSGRHGLNVLCLPVFPPLAHLYIQNLVPEAGIEPAM